MSIIDSEKETIASEAAGYMKQCGIPNKLHSRLLRDVCELIQCHQGNFKQLLPHVNIIRDQYWDRAIEIVLLFLKDNYLDLTLSTMKLEYEQLPELQLEDESAEQCLDDLIQDIDMSFSFKDRVKEFISDIYATIEQGNPSDVVQQQKTAKDLYPDIISSDYSGIEDDRFDGRFE